MRRIALFTLIIILFVLPSFYTPLVSIYSPNQHTTQTHPSFIPEPITLADDAYHTPTITPSTEWWYFDASLDTNHTVQFSIHRYEIYAMKFSVINLNIYYQGSTLIKHREIDYMDTIHYDQNKPLIIKNNEILMNGEQDNQNDSFLYTIQYKTNNASLSLTYQGITKGWKGTTPAGKWAVPLPQATVQGTITHNNETIAVSGEGYHDHNWDVTIYSGFNFGWIWGKTKTAHYAITWSTILVTWFHRKPLLVINKYQDGFTYIPEDSLTITPTAIAYKNGFLIPTQLNITGHTDTLTLSAEITIETSDYQSVLGLINYWRFHIHTTGTIQTDEYIEDIDDYDIAEFIRFRFY